MNDETAAQDSLPGTKQIARFACSAQLSTYESPIIDCVRDRVIDTLAAITAGYRHESGEVVRDHVLVGADTDEASMLDGTGRQAPTAEATFANATAANVLDIDDGHRAVKGHPAAVVVPAALAVAEEVDASVSEFLDAVYVGYEVAVRTGLTIHSVDGVYTGSGSWGAVGAAAAAGRLRGYNTATMSAALGTAEYHAPRTPIMRGVEQPGMTKDGIGWGSHVGVKAATLSEQGFTASGTVFDESKTFIGDLGTTHRVTESYIKPYPCCRWAQPGVEAVRELTLNHTIDPSAIQRIAVETFTEATHLETRHPNSLEAAEYSYAYPIAVTAVRGEFTETDLTTARRENPTVRSLAERVTLTTDKQIDDHFPEECRARVTIETDDQSYQSDVVRARGAIGRPLSQPAFRQKIDDLFSPTLPSKTYETVDAALNRPEAPFHQLVAPWK